jgi:hypothetical protein
LLLVWNQKLVHIVVLYTDWGRIMARIRTVKPITGCFRNALLMQKEGQYSPQRPASDRNEDGQKCHHKASAARR